MAIAVDRLCVCALALCVAGGAGSGDARAETVASVAVWEGSDFANRANAFWVGGAVALNRDISLSGFLFRADAEYAAYNYIQPDFNLGRVNGDEYQGDAMIGYQFASPYSALGLYVGVDNRYVHLSPNDITNSVRGQQTGVKFAADAETERDLPYYGLLDGYYSTAFDTYWAHARVGAKVAETISANLTRLFVGPEGIALGDKVSDAQRVGGFATFELVNIWANEVAISFSGGYQFVSGDNGRNGGNGVGTSTTGAPGPYGLIEFRLAFAP
jgi:hypothetical protein